MSFVTFRTRIGNGASSALPKGVCSITMPADPVNPAKLAISAPDALNGLREYNYVQFLWDAATNTLGIRKTTNSAGASKIQRHKATGVVHIAIPNALKKELMELSTQSGRFYFVDDPRHGFYTIDLTAPVPE